MDNVYLSYNSIISSLGFDSSTVVNQINDEISGISLIDDASLWNDTFYASLLSSEKLDTAFDVIGKASNYTRLEKMLLLALSKVITASGRTFNEKTGLIISTTKGNIDALENDRGSSEKAYLSQLAQILKDFFGFQCEPIVLSNACVSGLLGIVTAKRFIQQGRYDEVFVVGGDIISEFVLSGFNSFQAMSKMPCKPYSKYRDGITLGEAAACVLVTSNTNNLAEEAVQIIGEGSCNDANHISGPSRTGEGLVRSVQSALKEAGLSVAEIDYISAHGTATPYNDEMEAVAFNRLKMEQIPLNSFKGYFGHTLGASGLVETIIGMHSLKENRCFASLGFDECGVSKPLNIIDKTTKKPLDIFLKTSSGFGGCNTAAIFQKKT
jgi:3-oxoacyl-[acyl-carrier-protein] synthase-1